MADKHALLVSKLKRSIAAAKALGPLTPCSWCGTPRRTTAPLCELCNRGEIIEIIKEANK